MTIARILLIVALLVGIVIRSCTNSVYLDNLIKKIKLLRLASSNKAVAGSEYNAIENSLGSLAEQKDNIKNAELTDCTRTIYRFVMGLIPAVLACLLEKTIIDFVETAAGFLAPPFIIIFPACLCLKMYKNGDQGISKSTSYFAWFMIIVVGVGSYICVTLKLFYH